METEHCNKLIQEALGSNGEIKETTNAEKCEDTGHIYNAYDPANFSPLYLYRSQNDIVASVITHSGSEGIDRCEIGKITGLNSRTKGGSKRITDSIQRILKVYPNHFGQFQKMEGKYRMLKYYYKTAAPGGTQTEELFRKFETITGGKFPFKLGDAIKFPGMKLNTLRVSDVTLKRMCMIVELLYKESVIITRVKIQKYITSREEEEGYPFQIDRKSISKCIMALERHRFCRNHVIEYTAEQRTTHKVNILTLPEIESSDDPRVTEKLENTIQEFREQGRIFPANTKMKAMKKEVDRSEEDRLDEVRSEEDEVVMADEHPDEQSVLEDGVKSEVRAGEEYTVHYTKKTLIERTMRRLETDKNRSLYGSGKKKRSLLPLLSQQTIANLAESLKFRRVKLGKSKRQKKAAIKASSDNEMPEDEMPIPKVAKKRPYDTIDLKSIQQNTAIRNKFTPKEKDLLLLIRAFSFFLNPVPRFWPDPCVMRDIMHELVPDSRMKTANSLMAAGIRELKHKSRFAHHQYIVKTLASYPQLLELRNQLASLNLHTEETRKNSFFLQAFRTAYQLLFGESSGFPSVHIPDGEFQEFLTTNNMRLCQTESITRKVKILPLRSRCPQDEQTIKFCVAFNAIMSALLNQNTFPTPPKEPDEAQGEEQESTIDNLLEQFDSQTLSDVLDSIRNDGLITRQYVVKQPPQASQLQTSEPASASVQQAEEIPLPTQEEHTPGTSNEQNEISEANSQDATSSQPINHSTPINIIYPTLARQIQISNFYRHYFTPMYDPSIPSMTATTVQKLAEHELGATTSEAGFGELENPGELVALSEFLEHDNKSIDLTVPDSLCDLFVLADKTIEEELLNPGQNATKQLRYLEDSELQLERLQLYPDPIIELTQFDVGSDESNEMPNLEEIIQVHIIPKEKSHLLISTNEQIDPAFDNINARLIYQIIDESGVVGYSYQDLKQSTGMSADKLDQLIKSLISSYTIFPCGIDSLRYVSVRNAKPWVNTNSVGDSFLPRPWTLPTGKINWTSLTWMIQGVFSAVQNRPGILYSDLIQHFAYVLQPAFLEEILTFLERLGCCTMNTKTAKSMRKKTPFADFNTTETFRYVSPTHKGIRQLGLFLLKVKSLKLMEE